jgi:hypothetical protein
VENTDQNVCSENPNATLPQSRFSPENKKVNPIQMFQYWRDEKWKFKTFIGTA